jgi:hypothetical protein
VKSDLAAPRLFGWLHELTNRADYGGELLVVLPDATFELIQAGG